MPLMQTHDPRAGRLTSIVAGIALATLPVVAEALVQIARPDTPVVVNAYKFSVQPPPGWAYDKSGSGVTASRDGFMLNSVSFTQRRHRKAFAYTKQDSKPDALPEDLAESYIADFKQSPGIEDVQVLAIEPAQLAGKPAFKVRLTYRIAAELGGARYESITLGTALPEGLLLARYAAPQIHFFEKSLPQFEAAVTTLRFETGNPEK